jgi:hypothetical protein
MEELTNNQKANALTVGFPLESDSLPQSARDAVDAMQLRDAVAPAGNSVKINRRAAPLILNFNDHRLEVFSNNPDVDPRDIMERAGYVWKDVDASVWDESTGMSAEQAVALYSGYVHASETETYEQRKARRCAEALKTKCVRVTMFGENGCVEFNGITEVVELEDRDGEVVGYRLYDAQGLRAKLLDDQCASIEVEDEQ